MNMKSAVLVIDVQQGLFDGGQGPDEAKKIIQNINSLTSRARPYGSPVIFIQHEQATGFLEYESKSWKLQSELTVLDDDLKVRKTTPDSFLGTTLGDTLASLEVNNLIICGYATEFCVDTTTRRAAALGYSVQLVSDAHTTHDKDHASAEQIREHHNATLPNITSFMGKITAIQSSNLIFEVE